MTALYSFRSAMMHALRSAVATKPVLATSAALLDYLSADMACLRIERVRVLYLNKRNMLIKDQIMWEGSIDEVAFHCREVICRALELGAAALILVHNHPSGDAKPSSTDVSVTRAIAESGRRLGIVVHDHLVIASGGFSTMRGMGLI